MDNMEKQIWDVIKDVYKWDQEGPSSEKQEKLVKELAKLLKEVKDAK